MRGGRGADFGPGWDGGEARGRGHGHGRRGGGRLFDHGTLRWVLLSLIAEKPSHGYELIKAVETRLGDLLVSAIFESISNAPRLQV